MSGQDVQISICTESAEANLVLHPTIWKSCTKVFHQQARVSEQRSRGSFLSGSSSKPPREQLMRAFEW